MAVVAKTCTGCYQSPADEDADPGPHALWNLVPACATCNLSKSNRDPWAGIADHLASRGVALPSLLHHLRPDVA